MKRILITGGAGFIGSALCRYLIKSGKYIVCNIDKLTYAGSKTSLLEVEKNPDYNFENIDICNPNDLKLIFNKFKPDLVIHLAAESHVDRSIDGPSTFIQTNIIGTYNMLQCSKLYRETLSNDQQEAFRFLHISTDEVFGSLGEDGFFTEDTAYNPRSPYSASKASSDHLAMSWFHTYGLPVIISNCSNNYGPYQFPEKLIPLMTINALELKSLPIYGQGSNIRDWLYVEDHAEVLVKILEKGNIGEKYNIGSHNEYSNIEVVKKICDILDILKPEKKSYSELITFVNDRPGHDFRYAIDSSKVENHIGWKASIDFSNGIEKTIRWYLNNEWWWKPIREKYTGNRLGKRG